MHTRFPKVCYINNIKIIINRHIYTFVPDLKILHLTVLLGFERLLVASYFVYINIIFVVDEKNT